MVLEEKVGVALKDLEGRTALHWATLRGHDSALRLLLDNGADIGAVTTGADVAAKSEDKSKALHQAVRHGHDNIMLLLVKHGASMMAKNKHGYTALHVATHRFSNAKIVQLLIDHGADLAARNDRGSTALHEAVTRGYEEIVGVLLQAGADPLSKNNGGETPLHLATTKIDNKMVASLLIRYGADVTATDHYGQTALHMAIKYSHRVVVQLLLASGGDVMARTLDGRNALQCALDIDNDEILHLLLHHCHIHALTISEELSDAATEYLNGVTSSICCDGCEAVIPDSNTHRHCYMCDHGDYDLCQMCVDKGVKCMDPDHSLVERAFAAQRAHWNERTRAKTGSEPSYYCNAYYNVNNTISSLGFYKDRHCPDRSHSLVRREAQIPHVRCNSCQVSILAIEVFSHCKQCSDGGALSFDLCNICVDEGVKCKERSHGLAKRYFVKAEIGIRMRYMFIMDEEIRWYSHRLV
ncbi:hypothetical protein MMC18_008946 [Xylographa bjoerkii]|nr:hypothetical protein [Xylographa bjoerkii]